MVIERAKSMREQVYDKMKKMIITGEISPGERIKEIEYSQIFQISRTPIREAIRMLELEGLVESHPTGGVIVRHIPKSEFYEIYRIRMALENIVLEEIIELSTEDDIRSLEKILDDTKEEMDNKNEEEVFRLFSRFNLELYRISKLKKVSEMVQNMNLYLEKIRKMAIGEKNRKKEAYDDHRMMLKFIKDKNLEKLLKKNKEHLTRSMDFVLNFFPGE
ncbi:GntR family transcriptional regulator [Fusobacterium sp. PH5-44]|uniref:GntR family transcriptional regulator n=1 Tax=unclassified Fusobacterium TaxID=2648384 RepID=UPI003D23565E